MKKIRWSIITVLLIICTTTSLVYAKPDDENGGNGNHGNSGNHGGPPPNIPPSESSALNRDTDSQPGLGNAYAYAYAYGHNKQSTPSVPDDTYIAPNTQTNVSNIGSDFYVSANNFVNGNYIGDKVIIGSDTQGLIQFEISKETKGDIFENTVNQTGIVRATGLVNQNGVIKVVSNNKVQVSGALEAKEGKVQVYGLFGGILMGFLSLFGNKLSLVNRKLSFVAAKGRRK